MPQLPRDPRSIHVSATAPPAAPTQQPPVVAPETRNRRRRRRWPWVVTALLLVLALPASLLAISAWSAWSGVERAELSEVMSGSASGTNYLIVGTDSRDGVDPDTENAGAIFGEGVAGERTDTIAILRVDGGEVSLLAIPRDLYVPLATGGTNRINAAFAFGGAEALVRTIQSQLGIGIDHYLQVDLAGFLGLVDSLGGVTIDFPYPAFDPASGLAVDTAGPNVLDGSDALAYVRSRRYTEIIDGRSVTDPTSDLGRVQRQQQFLGAVMAELGATRNPFALVSAMRSVADHVVVDDTMGLRDAARLGLSVRGAQPITATIPVANSTSPEGASVLVFTAESEAVLAQFRG